MSNPNIQLAALGLEDYYLSSTPGYNFLEPNYQKHHNFYLGLTEIRANEKISFSNLSTSRSYTFELPKAGQFLHNLYLYVKVPGISANSGTYAVWTNGFMFSFIEKVELDIGGYLFSKSDSVSMDIMDELKIASSKKKGMSLLTGKQEIFDPLSSQSSSETTFSLPLDFWFSRDIKNAFPLALLKNQAIKITIYTRSFEDCITYDGNIAPSEVSVIDSYLLMESVYVEKELYKDFALKSFETSGLNYLFDTLYFKSEDSIPANTNKYILDLNFNYPVKELLWVFVEDDSINNNDYFNYSRRSDNQNLMLGAKLFLNGRVQKSDDFLPETFLRLVTPYQCHQCIPNKYIYVYSFSLEPEKIDPTGSLNFSAINSAQIYFDMRPGNSACKLYFYVLGYNILTIRGGEAKIKFI